MPFVIREGNVMFVPRAEMREGEFPVRGDQFRIRDLRNGDLELAVQEANAEREARIGAAPPPPAPERADANWAVQGGFAEVRQADNRIRPAPVDLDFLAPLKKTKVAAPKKPSEDQVVAPVDIYVLCDAGPYSLLVTKFLERAIKEFGKEYGIVDWRYSQLLSAYLKLGDKPEEKPAPEELVKNPVEW